MKNTPHIDGSFLAMLQLHRHGTALTDLSAAMQTITRNVESAGRSGSFTLKVTIKPAGRGSGVAFDIEDEIKLSPPKQKSESSIFFSDEQGRLVRNNPAQAEMELKALPSVTEEAATVPLKQVAAN